MLSVTKLNEYLLECQTDIPIIGSHKLLADDAEYARVVRDIVTEDTNVTLLAVLPSVFLDAQDEDNMLSNNKLMLFCIKKTDAKSGDEGYLTVFEDCRQAIIELIEKFNKDQTVGNGSCDIGSFVFSGTRIEPLRSFYGTNGYVMEIDLETF